MGKHQIFFSTFFCLFFLCAFSGTADAAGSASIKRGNSINIGVAVTGGSQTCSAGNSYSGPAGDVAQWSGILSNGATRTVTPTIPGGPFRFFCNHTDGSGATDQVFLTVTDCATNEAWNGSSCTANTGPVVSAGSGGSVTVGGSFQVTNASASDPQGISSINWSISPGGPSITNGNTLSPTFSGFTTSGTYTITITVTDGLGASNFATTQITVGSNPPPTVSAGPALSGNVGGTVTVTGASASDANGIASISWGISGPGSASVVSGQGSLNPTFGGFTVAGTYTITITATDNLGASSNAQTTINCVGSGCAAVPNIANCSIPAGTPGQTVGGSCVTGYQGTCSYRCDTNNGSWTAVQNSCTPLSGPTVTISATNLNPAYNTGTNINWSSTNASSCSASGAWSGGKGTSGSEGTGNLTSAQTYTLMCTGPGGSSAPVSVTVSPGSAPVAPVVNISASNPNPPYNTGTNINWSVSGATSCTAGGAWGGGKAVTGSEATGNLTSTQTYTLTCTGPGGSGSGSVTVTPGSAPTAPVVDLTALNQNPPYNTGTTLTWSASGATSCTAGGAWGGGKAVTGSEATGNLTSTQTYTLTCTGPGGSGNDSITVSPNTPPAPVVSLSAANPAPAFNTSTSLNWSVIGSVTSCTASGDWNGSKGSSGSESTGNLTANRTYVLTCTGPGGSDSASVNVIPGGPTAPTLSLTASPTSINAGGSSNLTWIIGGTSDACFASNNVGDGSWTGWVNPPTAGTYSRSVSPASTGIYSLECWNNNVGSGQRNATITVIPPANAPVVTISAANLAPAYNTSTNISWTSSGATSCSASVDWSGGKGTSGTESTGNLTSSKTYRITCTGPGGDGTDVVTVTPQGAPSAPVVSISAANPNPAYNTSTNLSWSASGATSCTAGGAWGGGKAVTGSEATGNLTSTQTYTLTCTGPGGSGNDSVTVTPGGAPSTPTVSISAANPNPPYNTNTNINWTSTGATSCTASGDWSGGKTVSGSEATQNLTTPRTYSIQCTGPGGTSPMSSVTVTPAAAPTAPSVALSVSNTNPPYNAPVNLSWNVTGTAPITCNASGNWSGTKGPTGFETTPNITSNQSYTLTCTNVVGTNSDTKSVTGGVPPRADLVPNGGISISDTSPKQTEVVTFSAGVRNSGAADAGSFANDFTHRWGTSGGWAPIGGLLTKSGLSVGNTSNDTSAGFTLTNSGILQIQYCVDSRWEVQEDSGEGNNCTVQQFSVEAALPCVNEQIPNADSARCAVSAGAHGSVSGSCDFDGTCEYRCSDGVWQPSQPNLCIAPRATLSLCDVGGANCSQNERTVNPGVVLEAQWDSNGTTCNVLNGASYSIPPTYNTGFTTGGLRSGTDSSIVVPHPAETVPMRIACTKTGYPFPFTSNEVKFITNAVYPEIKIVRADNGKQVSIVEAGTPIRVEWDTNNNDETVCTLTGGGLSTANLIAGGGGTTETGSEALTIQGRTTFTLMCGRLPDVVTIDVVPKTWES